MRGLRGGSERKGGAERKKRRGEKITEREEKEKKVRRILYQPAHRRYTN